MSDEAASLKEQGERWDALWSLTYDLQRDVNKLIGQRFEGLPPLWRAMGTAGLVEHLAEQLRTYVDLPPRVAVDDVVDAEIADE